MGSYKLFVASLSWAELGSALPQLDLVVSHSFGCFCPRQCLSSSLVVVIHQLAVLVIIWFWHLLFLFVDVITCHHLLPLFIIVVCCCNSLSLFLLLFVVVIFNAFTPCWCPWSKSFVDFVFAEVCYVASFHLKCEKIYLGLNPRLHFYHNLFWHNLASLTDRQTNIKLMYFRNTEKATLQHPPGREKAKFIIIQNKNEEHGGLAIDTYHYFTT